MEFITRFFTGLLLSLNLITPIPTPTKFLWPTIAPSPTIVQPSERALKAASYLYQTSSEKEKKKAKDFFKTEDDYTTIYEFALRFDQDIPRLIMAETDIENRKNKPVYQEPIIINNEQPVQQMQPRRDSINCSSNSIGNYTYTNCY